MSTIQSSKIPFACLAGICIFFPEERVNYVHLFLYSAPGKEEDFVPGLINI